MIGEVDIIDHDVTDTQASVIGIDTQCSVDQVAEETGADSAADQTDRKCIDMLHSAEDRTLSEHEEGVEIQSISHSESWYRKRQCR